MYSVTLLLEMSQGVKPYVADRRSELGDVILNRNAYSEGA
jgi:hypothetical protein